MDFNNTTIEEQAWTELELKGISDFMSTKIDEGNSGEAIDRAGFVAEGQDTEALFMGIQDFNDFDPDFLKRLAVRLDLTYVSEDEELEATLDQNLDIEPVFEPAP